METEFAKWKKYTFCRNSPRNIQVTFVHALLIRLDR